MAKDDKSLIVNINLTKVKLKMGENLIIKMKQLKEFLEGNCLPFPQDKKCYQSATI